MKLKLKYFVKKEELILALLKSLSTTVESLLQRPGIRASLKALGDKMLLRDDSSREIPEEAIVNAEKIAHILNSNNIAYERIGIDGIPGSGKSTLAKALAKLIGFEVRNFHHPEIESPCDLYETATIYEHHRLFRTQDIDHFDVLVYIDTPIKVAKEKVFERKKSGILLDVFDYDKLKAIGDLAFDLADWKSFEIPENLTKIKVRPQEGFNQVRNIKKKLKARDIHLENSCTKEEMLMLLAYGKKERGLRAYIECDAYCKDFINGMKAGLLSLIGMK